jgi:hypothetical protein
MTEVFLIVLVTICDALRDRWVFDIKLSDRWTWKHWRWYIVKWIAFSLPLIYVVIESPMRLVAAPLAIFCVWLWREVCYHGKD